MKNKKIAVISALLGVVLLFAGCSTTLREKEATSQDEGSVTKLKFEGQKVKLVHDF